MKSTSSKLWHALIASAAVFTAFSAIFTPVQVNAQQAPGLPVSELGNTIGNWWSRQQVPGNNPKFDIVMQVQDQSFNNSSFTLRFNRMVGVPAPLIMLRNNGTRVRLMLVTENTNSVIRSLTVTRNNDVLTIERNNIRNAPGTSNADSEILRNSVFAPQSSWTITRFNIGSRNYQDRGSVLLIGNPFSSRSVIEDVGLRINGRDGKAQPSDSYFTFSGQAQGFTQELIVEETISSSIGGR